MADGPCRVPLHLLESMTDNFSEDRVLGTGAYGKVYLGKREDGQNIAVKILRSMPEHGNGHFEKEFYNLANLQHQNIVQLVGYCQETRLEFLPHNETRVLAEVTKSALCFEFMEKGNLNSYLFDESDGHGWRERYTIIKGICNGLKYLHEELKPPIFHLDLKPANILLDKNMIPKIADFGLSRFFEEENSHVTNSPIGTLGYLPPEFIHHRIISNKLDIFSLGVVVIKIIAGPTGHCRSVEMTSKKFIDIVHGNWMNRLNSAASGDLLESYSEQVKRCVKIALSCVEADRQKRPTIGDIVKMLNETETQENYQGALIRQMNTCMVSRPKKKKRKKNACMVKDTNLIDVQPLQLHFPFRPNKLISCSFHVTNNMDDQHVSVRCVPKHEEATRYYANLSGISGVVPPRSTYTFVVTMNEVHQPPANMDVLDIVVETILGKMSSDYPVEMYFMNVRKGNSRGFHEVTLKAVCTTTRVKTTSEVILRDGDSNNVLSSMDVHPTEPWILAAYQARLVIWNYKTRTRMMQRDFAPGLAHAIKRLGASYMAEQSCSWYVTSVRFIIHVQLFVVGDGDGYIHVHDSMTMKRVKEFKAHGDMVTSFAVHPSEPLVLSASKDKLIKLWNWETSWECIRTFTGHSGPVWQLKFNPHDANTFASASCDATVKIWRISSPIHVTSLNCQEGQGSVDYYPTGGDQQHYMVTGSEWSWGLTNRTTRIWDLRTQTCIHEIKGHQKQCEVGVIDCHPHRPAVLVTASEHCGLSLHDSTTYRCERTVHFSHGPVLCFAYIKGIRSLAIAYREGVAIVEIDEFSKNVMPPAR